MVKLDELLPEALATVKRRKETKPPRHPLIAGFESKAGL